MILNSFIQFVLNFVFLIVNLIMIPIDLLIAGLIPDLTDGFTHVANFLQLIFQSIGWAISVSGIPTFALNMIIALVIFKLTVPFPVWLIKLGLKWYKTLKP